MSEESHFKILGYQIPGFLLVAATSWLSRLLTTAVSLVSIRILLDTLGVEHYAAYAVLMGAVSCFMLADMGIGQSLQNYISEARATQQGYANYILATAAITLVVVIIGGVAVVMLGGWPAIHLLSQFEFLTNKDKYLSFTTVAVLVMLTAGGCIVYRIWYAEHKGYLANIAAALAAVIALAGIYYVAQSDVENKFLWFLIAANAPMAALPVCSLFVRVWTTSRMGCESISASAKKILHRGGKFWLFNIAAAMVVQIDYIVLSQFVPAKQIVVYNLSVKIFAIAGFLLSAVLQAFWPVCAEASMTGDWDLIRSFTRRYFLWGMVFIALFTVCIAIFRVTIVSIFSSPGLITIPVPFIISLGVLYALHVWTDLFAVILQSMNDIKILFIWAVVQAVIGLGLQILLVPYFGIYGTVVALCLASMLTVSWVLPRRVRDHQMRSRGS